jgi:hypothetical protein
MAFGARHSASGFAQQLFHCIAGSFRIAAMEIVYLVFARNCPPP